MATPLATYRLQFTPLFTFAGAREIVPYLAELGVDHIYASPIFRPRRGSEHGYDVVEMNAFNPELGSADDFALLTEEARRAGLGWLQDIVPNHMAFDGQNPLLVDLLENGPNSRYFRFFDIDWEHFYEGLHGRVLAPFLGSFYGRALENGEIRLNYDQDGFNASYYDLRFALRIETYLDILNQMHGPLRRKLGSDHPDHVQFLGVLYLLKTLAPGPSRERYEQIKFIKQTLWSLYRKNGLLQEQLDATLAEFNGTPGDAVSFQLLDTLLGAQFFRLSFWKVATEELNYRRFFSINELISLRVEEKEVFDHCHGLVLKLVRQGQVTGLRVDHIDGLYDPQQYLERLGVAAPGCYLVVEKILEAKEPLPRTWPVAGTTGYDMLNAVNGLFVDRSNERRLSAIYNRFSPGSARCSELAYEKKRLIIERHMMGDVDNLAHLIKNFASRYRYGSDLTRYSLRRALIEVMVEFPVYRTYLTPRRRAEEGRRYLRSALGRAGRKNPGLANELEFLARILPLELDKTLPSEDREPWRHFVMRFQQFTGPLMAKGFEDTLLYVYNRLVSLNEVGGAPDEFGLSAEQFHAFVQRRHGHWPHTMNASATHDTKRGEDTRARINALSEMPQEWEQQLRSWSRLNRPLKKRVNRRQVPDKNDEYFLYQTLLGSFPLNAGDLADYRRRIHDYAVKAVREAKVHTGWLKPDSAYEDAYLAFVDALLADGDNPFLAEFRPFQEKIAFFGMLNSLAQTLLKITAPGLPDFYQGTELWDLSLVDPDNRRPVDYGLRRQHLGKLKQAAKKDVSDLLRELRGDWRDGRIKLFLVWRALQVRKEMAELWRDGDYRPLDVTGSRARHLLAFARTLGDQRVVVAVPRFFSRLVESGHWPFGEKVWGDTAIVLPQPWGGAWREKLSGRAGSATESLAAAELFADLPAAVITTE